MSKGNLAEMILQNMDQIAETAVKEIYLKQYDLVKDYSEIHKSKSMRDVKYHLQYLAQSLQAESVDLFLDYIDWAVEIMENIGIDRDNFVLNLEYLNNAIVNISDGSNDKELADYFNKAKKLILLTHEKPATFIVPENKLYDEARKYLDHILNTDRRAASELIMKTFEAGSSVKEIYKYIFQPVQWEIGRLWQINQISVAQEHFCTAVTQLVMSQLYPQIFSSRKIGKRFVAASVGNELHEIGIRMVADFFEMEGWDTYYLGANTPLESIVNTVKELKPHVLGLSTTITYHLDNVKSIIENIKHDKSQLQTRILVGGYPFNASADLWKKVGADGYAPDADKAIQVAENFL